MTESLNRNSGMTDRLRHTSQSFDFGGSVRQVGRTSALLREAADEIQRLSSWKAEALAVLAEWENVWEMAGKPGQLGTSKALSTMYEIERLRNHLAELKEWDRM